MPQQFMLLVLIRKLPFSDEREQLSALSHQQNTCKYEIFKLTADCPAAARLKSPSGNLASLDGH